MKAGSRGVIGSVQGQTVSQQSKPELRDHKRISNPRERAKPRTQSSGGENWPGNQEED